VSSDIYSYFLKGKYILTKFCITNFDKQSFLVKRIQKFYYFIFVTSVKKIKVAYLVILLTKYLPKNYFCFFKVWYKMPYLIIFTCDVFLRERKIYQLKEVLKEESIYVKF